MSVLSKIRGRAGLLVAIIGIALFAFILGDIFTSGRSMFSSRETNVGVIAGEDVSINDFSRKVEDEIEQMKKNNPNQPVDETKTDQVVQNLWQQTINEKVLNREYDKVGITVSTPELRDQMTGNDHNPIMEQYFTDQQTRKIVRQYATPDGRLDMNEVRKYVSKMNDAAEKSWVLVEKYVREGRKQIKYNNLIKKGLYVTRAQAKRDSADAASTYSIKYIAKKYATEPDSTTRVTDAELQTWYNAHQYKFKVKEATRGIEYVAFPIAPSKKDISDMKAEVKGLAEEFKNHKGKEDSAFVLGQSDSRTYVTRYVKKGSLSPEIDSIVAQGVPGTVVGPVEEGTKLVLYKVLGSKHSSDSAKVRHILIGYKSPSARDTTIHRTKEQAKLRADSVLAMIKSKKKKMEDLVAVYTDDPGSKNPATKEGEMGYKGIYGWFTNETGFAPAFKEAGLTGKKGDISIVETEFGYHIIEVLDKTKESDKAEIVTIERNEEPSKSTIDSIYLQANTFAGKNTNTELFEKAVVKEGMNKLLASDIKSTDRTIRGLESPKELVRWMFAEERKKGEVSQPYQLGERFVVALLSSVKEPGIAPLEEVKDKVEPEVKKEKKAEKFIAMLSKASAGAAKIEDVSAKLNEPAQSAENLSFNNSFIPGLGQENEVVGVVTASKAGTISKPIMGSAGVFVVSVEKITKTNSTMDSKSTRKQSETALQSRVDAEVFEALKDNAHIKDNRAKFY
jgi:peptidyl-prolyl cis-trans isomerase D